MNEQKEKTANQIIHEWMNPDTCWHEYAPDRTAWLKKRTLLGLAHTFVSNPNANFCVKCGQDAGTPLLVNDEPLVSTALKVPAYDEDLNAVAEVEAKVIETFGEFEYLDALSNALRRGFELEERLAMDDTNFIRLLATAPASVRAAAIVALIEEMKDEHR